MEIKNDFLALLSSVVFLRHLHIDSNTTYHSRNLAVKSNDNHSHYYLTIKERYVVASQA
jgi:hypothetical protein